MNKLESRVENFSSFRKHVVGSARVGKIVEFNSKNEAIVDYPGNPAGPIVARSIVSFAANEIADGSQAPEVLLVFEAVDSRSPVIVGVVKDQALESAPTGVSEQTTQQVKDVSLDGDRLTFDASKEIVLRCGKGSITLKKNGKIIVKGTELVSRALGSNKIKGANVNIN